MQTIRIMNTVEIYSKIVDCVRPYYEKKQRENYSEALKERWDTFTCFDSQKHGYYIKYFPLDTINSYILDAVKDLNISEKVIEYIKILVNKLKESLD